METLSGNKGLVVILGEKDSCVVILKRSHSDKKLQGMIDEGIINGTYAPTTDSTLTDLRKFQDFLRCYFKDKFTHYKDMRTVSNQLDRLYATAKSHRFNYLHKITVGNLKVRPII